MAYAATQTDIQSKEQISKPGDQRAKAAEIAATMELDVTPASIAIGEVYTIKVYLTPTNDKPFKLKSMTYMIRKNSQNGPWTPTTLLASALSRGERGLIAEMSGTWEAGTNTWVLDAKVNTDRGDTISNKVALRK